VLEKAKTMGVTSKQVALELGVDEFLVAQRFKALSEQNLISQVGRNLWILKHYEDMAADPLFTRPEVYMRRLQKDCGVRFSNYAKGITFSENGTKRIHRWSPYVQGFSAEFVEDMFSKYVISEGSKVLDPFCGSGTVLVCAKMRGIDSLGVDLMPLMKFMATVKTTWDLNVQKVRDFLEAFPKIREYRIEIPKPFLRETDKQFDPAVLDNLLRVKQFVWDVFEKDGDVGNLFKLALASILVSCSNLKRSPCLGYVKNKRVPSDAPFIYFLKKVNEMIKDLRWVQQNLKKQGKVDVEEKDARTASYGKDEISMAITSPPYVNGMDYVINYKIEMTWLELVKSYEDLRQLKEKMVVCDNVSRRLIKNYSPFYSDEWLDDICSKIAKRVEEKGSYRRADMHLIVRKYFDDIYPVLKSVYDALKERARFLIVIGDSLMAGIYIPADLIVAKMGKELGYQIEDILVARQRRSGQRHDFKLRESIVVLRKGGKEETTLPKTLERYL